MFRAAGTALAPARLMLATILHLIASHAISILMLSVGLQTDRALVHELPARRQTLLRALGVIWFAVPLVALVVVTVLRLPPIAATVMLVVAIAPGMPLIMRSARKAHGDPRLALMVLIATALTAIVMVPLWGWVLHRITGYHLQISVASVARLMLFGLVLPFLAGRLLRLGAPRIAAPLAKVCNAVFAIVVVLFVIAMLARAGSVLRELSPRVLVAILLFTVIDVALGWWAGGPDRSSRIAVSLAAALGNPALAIMLVAFAQPDQRALPLVATYILLRTIAMIPFQLWVRRGRPMAPAM